MKLATEFVRLPLRFDADRLASEVLAFDESDWKPHPQGYPGNSALSLVAAHGDPLSDATKGPMRETPLLARSPYLRQVLAALAAPIGRTRLMRLDGNAEATAHADTNYYWIDRFRVHIPVLTTPDVEFWCGDRKAHLPAGECWVFDTWKIHNVINPRESRRIHLVADTVGSPEFWRLVEHGEWPFADPPRPGGPPRVLPYRPDVTADLPTESSNQPVVMTPWEAREHVETVLGEAAGVVSAEAGRVPELRAATEDFLRRWRGLWARFGESSEGWPDYREALDDLDRCLKLQAGKLRLQNRLDPVEILRQRVVRVALNPDLAPAVVADLPAKPLAARAAPTPRRAPRFDRPVFIVCPPRSGSSLLFETLSQSPSLWTVGGESHRLIESISSLHPKARNWSSNRLEATEALPAVVERLQDSWFLPLENRDGQRPAAGDTGLRFLEKTPKNALRVPFLAAAFPDARFVYLYRHPREAIHSMWEAWKSGRFVTYPTLPGWPGLPWSLLLTPGWRELAGRDLLEIAARQWSATTEVLLTDLESLPPERWCVANYGRLVVEPMAEIERLCQFLGLEWDRPLEAPLPLSRHTLTPPEPGKWKKDAERLEAVEPWFSAAANRALEVFGRAPQHLPVATIPRPSVEPPSPVRAPRTAAQPLSSVHTQGVPQLLGELGGTLLLTTYQSGFLVAVRPEGEKLNTHFRSVSSPMGLAVRRDRFAVGTRQGVVEYLDVPAAAPRAEPPGRHDACFVPRREHATGDIRVHEMAYVGREVWVVATRFSCLARLAPDVSFEPVWRPRFVSALAPEDRCHLNGLALADGKPRYVTALGQTDTPQGWREGKGTSGVLIDVESSEIVASGLSMPHSPRIHAGKIWVLESGKGELGVVDPASGRVEAVARFPGFTRGLAFAGPYAFIGLSQVRESVFSGLPLTEQVRERQCGVWILDLRTAKTVGFLRFEERVQELFDVQWLGGVRFPEIAEAGGDLAASTFVLPEAALAEVSLRP